MALTFLYSNLPAISTVRALMQDLGTADQPAELLRYVHGRVAALARDAGAAAACL